MCLQDDEPDEQYEGESDNRTPHERYRCKSGRRDDAAAYISS
jgi:hypothetical protein